MPDLAESMEISPTELTYVVRLRHGVQFHNGRELTSEDVAYTFSSFLDPAFRGRSARVPHRRVGEGPDRYTVVFTLKEPFGPVPDQPGDGDRAGRLRRRERAHADRHGPVSAVEFVQDDRLVLKPFAGYWGGAPENSGLVLKVVPDDTMRGLELRKGTVDLVVNDLAPDIVWQLREEGRLQVVTAQGTDYAYIGLNQRDPILKHVEVRKAIGFAIDREAIVKYLRRGLARDGGRDRAADVVGIRARTCSTSTYDPAQARRLLDEAGFPDPDGDGPLPRFRLSLKTSTSEVYRVQAAVIQQDLARVGIAVDVRSSELLTLLVGCRARQLPALYAAVGRRDGSRTCCGACITRSRPRRPA